MEYLYAEQWSQAFNYSRQNAIDYVTITTWNEFPERTAIEPHFDATASSHDPYFLYNATKNYIAQLKGLDGPVYEAPKYWYQNPMPSLRSLLSWSYAASLPLKSTNIFNTRFLVLV
jgi:hypothetical protein